MKKREFIFSNKWNVRLLRHSVFWITCWLYMSLTYYFLQESWISSNFNTKYVSPGSYILLKTFLLVLVYIVPCYAFINLILPAVIKRKWIKAIAILLPLLYLMYGLGWLMYWKVFTFIDFFFGLPTRNYYPTRFWPAVVIGLVEPLKIFAAAAIIIYIKRWWFSQKEKETLVQEKMDTELQLLKAQISPGFLITALDNMYENALASSPRTPEILMKLSDLLSYMLYECEATFVPLQKEIAHMQDFILLEKLRRHDKIEIGLTVSGDTSDKLIAPFLLLPFIEYCLQESTKIGGKSWLNMDITVTDDLFTLKLVSGIKPSAKNRSLEKDSSLNNVQKRLSLLYPYNYKLKISREGEMLIVLLKIRTTPIIKKEPQSLVS